MSKGSTPFQHLLREWCQLPSGPSGQTCVSDEDSPLDRALHEKLEALITSATHLPEAIERDTVGVYQALARLRGVDRERLLDYRAGFLSR